MGLHAESSSPSSPSSFKQRVRSSICFSCCFRGAGAGDEERPASLIRSSTDWIRSKPQELLEIGGRCRGLVAKIGKHHGRRHSADCGYDPLSYALNFDEGPNDDGLAAGEQPLRYLNFSSRLPPSPPRPAVGISY